ncbi:MAG: single-stranded DNA-binding protein [Candidatus Omnitrophica bacterium]|nr:single-stranded DNA-binding protein [Candidatus Omnitrophota bacterium]
MSLEINSIIIGGNLTKDVVLKDTATGRKVCTLSLANNSTYISGGEKKVDTSFIDIDVWGAIAQNCSQYLKKGSPVVVTGRLKQERWETENGEKRNKLKVVATNVQFLSSGQRSQSSEMDDNAMQEATAQGWE